MRMICKPNRAFPDNPYQPQYSRDINHSNDVANFLIAYSNREGIPEVKYISEDFIDRFDQPSYGSGNVWISHARGMVMADYDPVTLWYREGSYWKIKSYYTPELVRIWPIYSRPVTDGTCPCTFRQSFSFEGTVWVSSSRPNSPYKKLCKFDGTQFVMVGGYVNAWGYSVVYYYRRRVYPQMDSVCFQREETFQDDNVFEHVSRVFSHIPTGGNTGYERNVSASYLEIAYLPDGEDVAKVPTLANTTAYSQYRYFCEMGTTGDGRANAAFGEAYIDAINNLPALYTNNIANILQAIDIIRGLLEAVTGHLPDAKSTTSLYNLSKEAWLAWRYQYSTTAADIYELADYLERISSVTAERVKTHGTYVDKRDGTKYRCTLTVGRDYVVPPEIAEALKSPYWVRTLGLGLTPENVWDMIPFSFMVDWFLHVGDALSYLSLRERAFEMDVQDIWYSMSREWTDDNDIQQSIYFRVAGSRYTGLPVIITDDHTSGKTWSKRIGDTVAIFG